MKSVADYVADFIAKKLGIKQVFMVTGGGAMFLNDSIGRHKDIESIFTHHEQAATMAALGFAKYANTIGVVCVTTGCGGTNTLTGVLDAYQDSIPLLIISGQVKTKDTSYLCPISLRQFGVQEANIVSIVKPITKYALTITNPTQIAYHLEKASFVSRSGRPGPVWIDIPMDIQSAMIDESSLTHFDCKDQRCIPRIDEILEQLARAKRPIIIAGNGIRISNSVTVFREFVQRCNVPVVTSFLGIDLLPHDEPHFIGRIGIKGDRAGNFALQNADFVLVLGCRLSVAATGFEYGSFAREAKVVVVDIDSNEHKKNTIAIDEFIQIDLRDFFNQSKEIAPQPSCLQWLELCNKWKKKWTPFLPRYATEPFINKYTFIEHLCKKLHKDSVVVSDAGSAYYVASQALFLTRDNRYITSGAQADMGFSLPACIGVCFGKYRQEVIGITGDGSLQMNIQELQTMVHYQLPIKLFVWNNNGYLSIRATQDKFFAGIHIGTDVDSGISFPNLEKIAYAYGIEFFKVDSVQNLSQTLDRVFAINKPVICEIICPKNQEIIPNVSSLKLDNGTMISKPLEDMYPYLDREEFYQEMIIKPMDT
ncbi:thiamine pyrophosphate-binding protein [Helicobacter sp.]|uniref:thiamine pyrophosphate-binding protein n=1 Tax=Helicobacter sp. TaxID=218 RepID=UPI0025BA42FD|nr:thiamine pyrophosphate-binding protein [Helicobacter sp.]MBR2495418.1 thiamine pyrophosphate-binding protein [Helicobacter sp.]